jgi:hypothetical protein
MFRRELKQAQREIKKNGLTGGLADALMNGTAAVNTDSLSARRAVK